MNFLHQEIRSGEKKTCPSFSGKKVFFVRNKKLFKNISVRFSQDYASLTVYKLTSQYVNSRTHVHIIICYRSYIHVHTRECYVRVCVRARVRARLCIEMAIKPSLYFIWTFSTHNLTQFTFVSVTAYDILKSWLQCGRTSKKAYYHRTTSKRLREIIYILYVRVYIQCTHTHTHKHILITRVAFESNAAAAAAAR